MSDVIDYGKLVDEAMHVIVYKVLKAVQDHGLPGNHHFFISFITKYPGVKISPSLTNKYPKDMTIVLQYQFKNLKVDTSGFSVSLSFNGTQEAIYIPFNAITTFADPSVQFGLQFREVDFTGQEELSVELTDQKESEATPGKKGKSVKKASKAKTNIVSLDKFRNKK